MKTFKSMFLALALVMSAQSAFAMGGGGGSSPAPGPGPGGGFGHAHCSASDKGWEEHFGGHSNCGDCLAKHGGCIERCYVTSYRCIAEGQDVRGITQTFEANSRRSGSDARQEALDRCYYSRMSGCRIQTCDTDDQLISSRSCK
ncbi:MAG: hypothetical protein AB7P04_06460 [Bacteriovoracia bacterium]